MMSIAAITVVTLVGLLFAAMAVAPVLIEPTPAKATKTTPLVLIERIPGESDRPEHLHAA